MENFLQKAVKNVHILRVAYMLNTRQPQSELAEIDG